MLLAKAFLDDSLLYLLVGQGVACADRHVDNDLLGSGKWALAIYELSVVHALSHVLFRTINYCCLNNFLSKLFRSWIFIAVLPWDPQDIEALPSVLTLLGTLQFRVLRFLYPVDPLTQYPIYRPLSGWHHMHDRQTPKIFRCWHYNSFWTPFVAAHCIALYILTVCTSHDKISLVTRFSNYRSRRLFRVAIISPSSHLNVLHEYFAVPVQPWKLHITTL